MKKKKIEKERKQAGSRSYDLVTYLYSSLITEA